MNITYGQAVSRALRNVRLERGLTMREVSKRSFVSLGFISEIERASKTPSYEVLEQLFSKGLELTMHEWLSEIYAASQGKVITNGKETL